MDLDIILPEAISEEDSIKLLINYKKTADYSVRNFIIEHNLRLVIRVIKKNYFFDNIADIFDVGVDGLIKAIESFDVTKNTKFAPYAAVCIYNEIGMFLRKIKVRSPFDKNLLPLVQETDYILDENSHSFFDYLYNNDFEDEVITNLETSSKMKRVNDYLDKISDRDKHIIEEYFGLGNNESIPGIKLSPKYGITQSAISLVISKHIKRLRSSFEENQQVMFDYEAAPEA